jgi:hypothetical protein
MAEAHTQLAAEAQEAVITAYEAARAESRAKSGPYRIGDTPENYKRYAGGAMLGALSAEGFVVGTETGIDFGNIAILNSTARQWARLNYGAGGAAGPGGARFAVRWGAMEVASLGLEGGPRPGFRLPRGFWFSGGSRAFGRTPGAEFYPVGHVPSGWLKGQSTRPDRARMTRGIRGEHWLDAGIAVIAEGLGPKYRAIYDDIYLEAKGIADGAVRETFVRRGVQVTGFRGAGGRFV